MVKCPKCQKSSPNNARRCKNCGASLKLNFCTNPACARYAAKPLVADAALCDLCGSPSSLQAERVDNQEAKRRADEEEYLKLQQEAIEEKSEGRAPDEKGHGEPDCLLAQALELAIDSGQISASMLQRRFCIGYARAGRLLDKMEKRERISGFEGSKPRRVLVGRDGQPSAPAVPERPEDIAAQAEDAAPPWEGKEEVAPKVGWALYALPVALAVMGGALILTGIFYWLGRG